MAWSMPKRYEFEGPQPKLGPGVSRPLPKERTRLYRVSVKVPGSPAMRVTIPAASRGKAIQYCQNRWPTCSAEVIE
jgi:hypothetical protein